MNEFAPEYTNREKVRRIAIVFAIAIPLGVLIKYWLTPMLGEYAKVAHCRQYGPIGGLEVLFYGMFVGFPLMMAAFLAIFEGRRSIKIIKLGQYPLPGEKVAKPTRYTYGFRAKVAPIVMLGMVLFLIGLSVRGVFWAHDIVSSSRNKHLPTCISS